MLTFSKLLWAVPLAMVIILTSCTDLEESISSEVTGENFFQTEEEFVSALGDAYTLLGEPSVGTSIGGHGGWASIQEVSTDEIIIPQRGQDWFDGGIWLRAHRHTFNYDEGYFNNAWQWLFSGVNSTNRLVFQFTSAVEAGNADPAQAEQFIAELRALRAFYYYLLLDTFGNVPIITSFQDAPESPSQPDANFQTGRQAVFDFVESELLASVDAVSDDVQGTYGRVNKFVVHMILAKLYMNAEVYTGNPRWSDAITQLDAIIDSGNYSLAANYRNNFITNNSGSPELIFVVPFDKVFLGSFNGFNIHQMSLHYGSQNTFNLQFQPWNGYASMQEFYESYIDPAQNPGPQGDVWGTQPTSDSDGLNRIQGTLDARLDNFFVGPQFSAGGDRITDAAVFSAFDANGAPLTFTPAINQLEPDACRQCGVRVGKFEIENGVGPSLSVDFPIFRYSDVLLMKAEALWRLNPSDANAATYLNMVRNRAGVDDFSAPLTADQILAERGREMFYEMVRRQDLIRFAGTNGGDTRFNDPWEFKNVSSSDVNVFPIPRDQCEANDNLVQNPGYQPC